MADMLRVATLSVLCTLTAGLAGCERREPAPGSEPPAAAAPAAEPAAATFPRTAAPAGARATIVSPVNGATVTSPVTVQFAVEGMALAPAGTFEPGTGHHHVLVDVGMPALDQPIPTDANHVHFGKAQTEAQLDLAPGTHTLQLLLGDGNHVPHDPPVASEPITITVQ
jgi:hypothetical protein